MRLQYIFHVPIAIKGDNIDVPFRNSKAPDDYIHHFDIQPIDGSLVGPDIVKENFAVSNTSSFSV